MKSGYLLKKNEQGNYQRRFLCLVPHTFLYYFDSDTADAPRGVIDIELYNNLSLEGEEFDILKMATFDESRTRYIISFFSFLFF